MEPIRINPEHVPEQFRYLLPLAKRWGIKDDGYRGHKVVTASAAEIEELRRVVLPIAERLYIEWLEDPSQMDTPAKDAYLIFTALVLAAEESSSNPNLNL